jgi:sugar/nucleoside kinase (ribokinase family)
MQLVEEQGHLVGDSRPMPAGSSPLPRLAAEPLDLLIVGALTIDSFEDGSSAPGGSVLHAARAAAGGGYSVGAVTVAGSEPEAQDGLRELRRLGPLHAEPAPSTLAFAHRAEAGERRLVLVAPPQRLVCPSPPVAPAAVLYAPVADEFGAGLAGQRYDGACTGAILQGWLRTLDVGQRVRPLPLSALPAALVDMLSGCRVMIASREDLLAVAADVPQQLDALRARFGGQPALIVTDGARGAWLEDRAGRVHIPAPAAVSASTASTVGAGDAFAAMVLAELGRGAPLRGAARVAASAVVEMLRRHSA